MNAADGKVIVGNLLGAGEENRIVLIPVGPHFFEHADAVDPIRIRRDG